MLKYLISIHLFISLLEFDYFLNQAFLDCAHLNKP